MTTWCDGIFFFFSSAERERVRERSMQQPTPVELGAIRGWCTDGARKSRKEYTQLGTEKDVRPSMQPKASPRLGIELPAGDFVVVARGG